MNKTIRPEHVAIYIRWSTDDQGTGTTLDVQRDSCLNYARSQGWSVSPDQVYVDDGYSGATLDRPALTRLRQQVADGEIDCVIVMKTDRLSRNIVDAVQLVLREWADRCYFKSVLEPVDTTTEFGRMIFGLLAMFADFERATIRERTQAGKVRRIAAGEQMHAGPAFGYRRHPSERGRWVEHPEEAPIVRRIFQMAAAGLSAHYIARALNTEGVRTRRGRFWSLRAILWILHNPTYIGRIEYGRTSVERSAGTDGRKARTRRTVRAVPAVRATTDAAPALVPQALWLQAQATLDNNRRARRAGSRAMGSPHLLVGLARCVCGRSLVYRAQRNGNGTRVHGYYVCSAAATGACTESGYIPAHLTETLVATYFAHLYGVVEVRWSHLGAVQERLEAEREAVAAALRTVESKARRYQEEEARILQAARAGTVPFGVISDLLRSLERDRATLDAELRTLQARAAALDERAGMHDGSLATLTGALEWTRLPVAQRRHLLRLVLADLRVVRRKGTAAIHIQACWRY
jgi:site-specific DNA recombinase